VLERATLENLSLGHALGLVLRLLASVLLGGLLGYQRQRSGKVAGLRTHMLVALGSATLVVATVALRASSDDDVSRVVQGVAAGIGFMGAGAILKLPKSERVQGLTTAASVWMAATIGVAAGLGSIWIAASAAFLSWLVLGVLARFEPHVPGDA
jgi:putative Mg2+ transporter-C (MgtC) family protein